MIDTNRANTKRLAIDDHTDENYFIPGLCTRLLSVRRKLPKRDAIPNVLRWARPTQVTRIVLGAAVDETEAHQPLIV